MDSKILIVGTVPYSKKATSRAFEAYFSGWDRDRLAQIFSNPHVPAKGHCGELFQITDQRMLRARLRKGVETGRIYRYADLREEWDDDLNKSVSSGTVRKLYRIGSRKNSLIYLLRGALWSKRFWCTGTLLRWLDDFQPDCVFLSFSDDFFIPRIALFAAQRFDVPIVSSIGDDYYFNDRFSLSPLYHAYRLAYKRLIRRVFAHGGSAIYISDKIRDRYNAAFSLHGETVYLTSEVRRRPFRPVNRTQPKICYFGNIRQGRSESLAAIGTALGEIDPSYRLEVCSNQSDPDVVRPLLDNPNVDFLGSVPYDEVTRRMSEADVLVIVEGFKKQHVNMTRYSLSTKAADCLASGAAILVYGSEECGVISYMRSTDSAAVCSDPAQLTDCIRSLLDDEALQKRYYENAISVTERNHTLAGSTKVFRSVVKEAVDHYEKHA